MNRIDNQISQREDALVVTIFFNFDEVCQLFYQHDLWLKETVEYVYKIYSQRRLLY